MQTVNHLINGTTYFTNEHIREVYNPSTGEISKYVAMASQETIEKAIDAAIQAFPLWRNTPALRRARILFRYKELLEKNADTIAQLIGDEHGKILHDARGELQRGIENVEFACGIPQLLKGDFSRNVGENIDTWSDHQSLGVVAGITPFNFPVMVPLWMFPLAIACGNTFILKPSEKVPSSTLFIAQLLYEAGLPEGVLNVVNGDQDAVNPLLRDPRIAAISFVGSTPVAEKIYATATAYGKRCQALGGAKNHAIIMPDADLDNVVSSLLGAAFGSSGERCMALSVAVVVGDEMADRFIAQMRDAIKKLKIGSSTDNRNDFGPLVTQEHLGRVTRYIGSAEFQGASIVVDGRNHKVNDYPDGFYIGATLIDGITTDMESYQAEIFGPVLQVIRVKTLEEAITIINENEHGNGTCIYTRDGETAHYFSNHIEVGMVGINIPLPVPVATHSFGGWKRFLFGDLNMYGPDGVRFYTRRKTITQRWPSSSIREGTQFSMPT